MDFWRHIEGVPAVVQRGHSLVVGGLTVIALLSCVTGSHAQQGQSPKARGSAIPTIEALPHSPMPAGDFVKWCGERAVYRGGRGYEIYDGGTKASPLTFPIQSSLHCGYDAQKLVFVDEEAGLVSEVDIAGGAVTRTLATYDKGLIFQRLSFSPDLESVTSSEALTLAASGVNLKTIHLKALRNVRWSRDSSRFFGVTIPKGSSSEVVEIFNGLGRTIASGPLPAGFSFRDGWFASSQALYLLLYLSRDEFGSEVVFRCSIVGWKCERIASNVLGASMGGEGVLGIVSAIGKYSNDGDRETFPPLYSVEVRNGSRQMVARQTFKSAERSSLSLSVAPSGTKAILTWSGKSGPGCPPERQKSASCKDGIIIDLSGRPK